MSVVRNFYYNEQMRNYLKQFMAIFAGLQVQVGWNEDKEPRLISTPIVAASKDRVAAAIKGANTQNKPLRLPLMSAYFTSIDMAPELRKGVGGNRRNTMMPVGGVFPDDLRVVEQRMPVSYRANLELALWASNQDQHMQLIEQILALFDPILQIQTSDDVFDWTKITTVELMNVRLEENLPAGNERRIIQSVMEFSMPIYISVPADVHKRYVEDILMRIGALSDETTATNYDIIADFDQQGLEYQIVASGRVDDIA